MFLFFTHSFRPNEGDSSCPEYILEDGRTVGCVLQAEGDGILSFSIRRGTRPLLAKSQWISSYRKCPEARHSYPSPEGAGLLESSIPTPTGPKCKIRPHPPQIS